MIGVLATSALAAGMASCASQQQAAAPEVRSAYEATFDAARDVLREEGFELQRIDALAGVITTRPRESSGLATPWINDGPGALTGVEGMLHHQRRQALVTIGRGDEASLDVRVVVERIERPGRRIDSASLRSSSRYVDEEWARRGLQPATAAPIARDPEHEARLVSLIERRAAETAPVGGG